uniref:Uncharacterized protein n=1 Tax=Lactococcus lactis subsp. lactis TaxID=1360 RepID=Q9RAV0_LACLL|nr:unknown [Lactococcus lactis subsp. lactis]
MIESSFAFKRLLFNSFKVLWSNPFVTSSIITKSGFNNSHNSRDIFLPSPKEYVETF